MLYAGDSSDHGSFSLFKVTVEASEEGICRVPEIVAIVQKYICMLQSTGPREWLWKEIQKMEEIEFAFKNEERPMSAVSRIAGRMHLYSPEHTLSGGRILREYDADMIADYTNRLSLSSCQVIVAHKGATADATEPWYGTKYSTSQLPIDEIKRFMGDISEDALHLPPPNDFLPASLDVLDAFQPVAARSSIPRAHPLSARLPPLAHFAGRCVPEGNAHDLKDVCRPPVPLDCGEGSNAVVWFKQDVTYCRPKLVVMASIFCPNAYATAENAALAELFVSYAMEALNEYAYAASIAGLSYSVSVTSDGLSLVFAGFNDKVETLLNRVCTTMAELHSNIDEATFNRLREKLQQTLTNWDKKQPYQHAMYHTDYARFSPYHHMSKKRECSESMTIDAFRAFARDSLFQKIAVEALVVGNATAADAIKLARCIETTLGSGDLAQGEVPDRRLLKIPGSAVHRMSARDAHLWREMTQGTHIMTGQCTQANGFLKTCGMTRSHRNGAIILRRRALFSSTTATWHISLHHSCGDLFLLRRRMRRFCLLPLSAHRESWRVSSQRKHPSASQRL